MLAKQQIPDIEKARQRVKEEAMQGMPEVLTAE